MSEVKSNRKIISYHIEYDSNPDFNKAVNESLKNGWEVYGLPIQTNYYGDGQYIGRLAQAFVKYEQ